MPVSIEVIALEHFSASQQLSLLLAWGNVSRHSVFQYVLSSDSKRYSATIAAQSERIIFLSENIKLYFVDLCNIWGNTDGYTDQYICVTSLYLI